MFIITKQYYSFSTSIISLIESHNRFPNSAYPSLQNCPHWQFLEHDPLLAFIGNSLDLERGPLLSLSSKDQGITVVSQPSLASTVVKRPGPLQYCPLLSLSGKGHPLLKHGAEVPDEALRRPGGAVAEGADRVPLNLGTEWKRVKI